MKVSDFSSKAPGHVIKTLKGYVAFIPAPLPPDLQWSEKIVAALSKADRSLAKLSETGNAFPAPHMVAKPFIRKEAVLSSHIEGTQTTFQELLSYEAGQLSMFRSPEDTREVHNYVLALDYGLERLDKLPVSNRLICEIHAVLMEGVRGGSKTPGEFRRTQNWIGRPGATLEQARYVPPPPEEMKECLSDLERFIHSDSEIPPLLQIGMIHYQFEAIHPFLDGNGRIGRLLVTFLLVVRGLLVQPLLNLSNYFENNRQEYYNRLLALSQKGAWEEWLLYFLEGVRTQADDAIRRIVRLQEIRLSYQKIFAHERTRESLSALVDYLISSPITTINQVQANLHLGSYNAARRHIEKLEAMGIVREITGNKRNRLYMANEIMRALEDQV